MDEWLTSAARARPDHAAIVAEGRAVGYAELEAAARRVAGCLAALGIGPGDRVATTLPPGHAFGELLHALPKLGAVLVPLDPRRPARVDARLVVTEPVEAEEADVELRARVDPDAVHSAILTSGTTGEPRAVELTYRNHHASALASAARIGTRPDDRWLCPLPLFHVGGLAVLLRSAIHRTTAVLHPGFDTGAARSALEDGDVTLASLVPTMLQRLREAGLTRAPGLRALLLGGGPIPPGLLEWADERALPVLPTYGMTETASSVAIGVPGEPLEGVELRIGERGEILVRGPMVAPAEADADGWLHTGDVGRLDERGRLRVEGRLKDLIVTGGENVAPALVESVLTEHPAVAEAAVVGTPDTEWGEAVTAYVVLREQVDPGELRAWCRARLAAHEAPKRVFVVHELPRSPAGKLLRDRLAVE